MNNFFKNINNKTLYFYIAICAATLIFGIIFYGIYNDIIIIKFPTKKYYNGLNTESKEKKLFKLHFYKSGKFNTEEKELISSNNIIQTASYLVTSFLNLAFEENVIPKKVNVQAILSDVNQKELYISFDRNILPKESSTFDKLMIIESLLKTINSNLPNINSIHFLINHTPIQDRNLDFSHAWPVTGYINKK